jgi:transposase InsO family protein
VTEENGDETESGTLQDRCSQCDQGHPPGDAQAMSAEENICIVLENYFFPADLEAQIEAFVDHYNHRRYHEGINNLPPADVYFGRGHVILQQRERIKRKTMKARHLKYRKYAA